MNNVITEEQNGYSQVFIRRPSGAGCWATMMTKSRHGLWTHILTNGVEVGNVCKITTPTNLKLNVMLLELVRGRGGVLHN